MHTRILCLQHRGAVLFLVITSRISTGKPPFPSTGGDGAGAGVCRDNSFLPLYSLVEHQKWYGENALSARRSEAAIQSHLPGYLPAPSSNSPWLSMAERVKFAHQDSLGMIILCLPRSSEEAPQQRSCARELSFLKLPCLSLTLRSLSGHSLVTRSCK